MSYPLENKLIKISISDKKLQIQQIDIISRLLNNNKVIILPAKTMYGISARFDLPDAVKKIYEIKKRPIDLPFIILISDHKMLEKLVADISLVAKRLIKVFWDKKNVKPLTLIFRKNITVKDFMANSKDTIAIRMAEFDFVRKIIDRTAPIISTSANLSGAKKNPLEIEDIPAEILDNIDMIVKHEEKLLGIQSTIVDVSNRAEPIKLIRQGALPFEEILQKI